MVGCEWREIQRRNQLPSCVQENMGAQIDVYPRLEEVEANLLKAGALRDVTKTSYRSLVDSLYTRILAGRPDDPSGTLTRPTLCSDVEDCDRLTTPSANVAYPLCYREIAQEYDLPDSTGFWATQGAIWTSFLREGNWAQEEMLRSIDATPPNRFAEFEVRAFYSQHVLYLTGIVNSTSTAR
ncbi:hypothetical protein CRI94_17175 [Longibacter salinarum]|uniref:Uncharacterized protein n=2 Tax=Longibacter salinarum TaxID=1850348 RepID=A0A2A8CU83_9BACT|nr:hypothetical protein CRI94_17175 [Longibacter salinarum]